VGDHRTPDPTLSVRLERMHGFQLGKALIQALERRDSEDMSRTASTEEGDRWFEQLVNIQGEGVLRGRCAPGECQVGGQHCSHVLTAGIVNQNF
jgi:hypothetical protein